MGLWVGSYAGQGGKGLYPLERDGDHTLAGAPEPGIANASFAVWSQRHRLAYFVDEMAGRISAWRYDAGWQSLGSVESGGELPCYLALSDDERWLACANYGDGCVTVLSINPDTGALAGQVASFRAEGHGVDPERQEGPHAHCVVFAQKDRALYHVDLGLDRIYRHDVSDGRIVASEVAFAAPAGSGPRHLAFHPSGHALLICELSATLMLLGHDGARFRLLQSLLTAPEPCPDNLGGHLAVHADGSVWVTNRGHDSVARFEVHGDRLCASGWQFTQGQSPRHVHAVDGAVLVAHEESGGVTQVPLPLGAGTAKAIAAIPGAAFILSIPG